LEALLRKAIAPAAVTTKLEVPDSISELEDFVGEPWSSLSYCSPQLLEGLGMVLVRNRFVHVQVDLKVIVEIQRRQIATRPRIDCSLNIAPS
jgi:hypothetical protein